jgi:DnaK suppressor protein
MARSDKLLKITKMLLGRRAELLRRLGMDLLALDATGRNPGDIADDAFRSVGVELSSQLAEYESAELAQIELALARLKQGRYGLCDMCEKKIPAARMNAVPYSIMCIGCQEVAEKEDNWMERHSTIDFAQMRDAEQDMDYAEVQHSYGK